MEQDGMLNEIIEALEALGLPERREQMKSYCPTAQRVIGVTGPDLKEVLKVIRAKYSHLGERDWIGICKALVETGIFDCQMLAYERIGRDKKLLAALDYRDVKALWKNLDNWASVDSFSVGIHGVLWGRGVVTDLHISNLLDSGNVWDRRVAVVSTVSLNLKSRGGTGDTGRTLAVCERVVDERQDMIWKALSWALRELSKRDRDAVYGFVEKYENRLSKRVLREVNHKLEYGTKN